MTKLSAQSIGVDVEKLQYNARCVETAKQVKDDAQMALAQAFKDAEEAGINRAALKHVLKLKHQDAAKTRDFQRCVEVYSQVLGLDAQIDLFEQQEGQDANAESVEKASRGPIVEDEEGWPDEDETAAIA